MIDWRRNETDQYELLSACGGYRIAKNPWVYPVEYTPYCMDECASAEGYIVKSWKRIEKPKHTADEAKEICEQWLQNKKS